MDTRLKLLALACVAPLALVACDSGEEQVAEVEEPVVEEPAAEVEVVEPEAEVAEAPEAEVEVVEPEADIAEAPEAEVEVVEPEVEVTEAPAAGGAQQIGQAPQPDAGAAGEAQEVNFAGNWAMEGEACPGNWEFSEQTIEVPEQGTFEVQDVQQNGQEVELEVASMEGGETQTLALEFPEAQQDRMIVRNAGDEVTLQRCE